MSCRASRDVMANLDWTAVRQSFGEGLRGLNAILLSGPDAASSLGGMQIPCSCAPLINRCEHRGAISYKRSHRFLTMTSA